MIIRMASCLVVRVAGSVVIRARRFLHPVPVLAVALAAVLAWSCGPLPDSRPQEVDLLPPQLKSVRSDSPEDITVTFDEEAAFCEGKTRISPSLSVTEEKSAGTSVLIHGEKQAPGRRYVLEAEARDGHGNTASFAAEFYGYNGRVPPLLINEFTPRGSGSHPDAVELKAHGPGNLGGVVLCLGSPGNYDARLVFPPLEVTAGSFIVVHLKPTGDPSEVDETVDPASSGGADASRSAWDFWMRDAPGLPGNNGVLSLCDRPGGACLDAVLWSNRTAESDEQYGGFGSEQMRARAEELASRGAWKPAGARISPEDGVNPEGSTGTRSICRSSASADTGGADDWHIVPTRKASLGSENSDEVYAP
jgi:hypothetical protein